jgi:tRNA pseudouridine13 synthase
VRNVEADGEARARAILERLAQPPGAPNWYGEQRFGRDGDNAERGLAIVSGATPPRDRKLARLLVSALQSKLFNAWLVARVADGLYARVIDGDILHKTSGGQFVCEDPKADEPRLTAGELCVTGPMFGDRMRKPPAGSAAATREEAVLEAAGLTSDAFGDVAMLAEGTRRDSAIMVGEPRVRAVDNTVLEVSFTLPGGAYATAVMRELMKMR